MYVAGRFERQAPLTLTECYTMRTHGLIFSGLLLVAAACADSPSDSFQPEGPPFDGGWTAGSGNRITDSADSVSVAETPLTETTACEGRGGWTAGSGKEGEPVTCSEVE